MYGTGSVAPKLINCYSNAYKGHHIQELGGHVCKVMQVITLLCCGPLRLGIIVNLKMTDLLRDAT